jgi:hypothetical protein
MTPTALATRTQPAAGTAFRIALTRDVAEELGRYLTPITAAVRATFDAHRATTGTAAPAELVIDLTDAARLPQAQLTLLLTLLRPIVGDGTTITLSGVRPMILGALVAFDLPDDVVVTGTRGRRWTEVPAAQRKGR